jgi:hypothetical protein
MPHRLSARLTYFNRHRPLTGYKFPWTVEACRPELCLVLSPPEIAARPCETGDEAVCDRNVANSEIYFAMRSKKAQLIILGWPPGQSHVERCRRNGISRTSPNVTSCGPRKLRMPTVMACCGVPSFSVP